MSSSREELDEDDYDEDTVYPRLVFNFFKMNPNSTRKIVQDYQYRNSPLYDKAEAILFEFFFMITEEIEFSIQSNEQILSIQMDQLRLGGPINDQLLEKLGSTILVSIDAVVGVPENTNNNIFSEGRLWFFPYWFLRLLIRFLQRSCCLRENINGDLVMKIPKEEKDEWYSLVCVFCFTLEVLFIGMFL